MGFRLAIAAMSWSYAIGDAALIVAGVQHQFASSNEPDCSAIDAC